MGMEGVTNHDNESHISTSKIHKNKVSGAVEGGISFETSDPADITDVWSRGRGGVAVVGEEEPGVKISHSKKVIKHALKQQAKRRRKNTNIAAGCNSTPRLQSHGSPSELDEVSVSGAVCYRQPTMAEVLSSIPGFNVKPRKRSTKKLSAAAQLEQTKEGCVDLETPDSILVNSNLRQLMNKHTFSSLPPLYQYKLLQLLPHVDRAPAHSDYVYRLSPSGLNNEFFARACMDWRERLTDGEFTPDNQAKLKAEQDKEKTRLDPWKLKHFEPMWGESLEEWPSIPAGVLERSSAVSASPTAAADCASAAPPVKKKRGSASAGAATVAAGSKAAPPVPAPAPRPVRTVGAVTRAQSSYREKRQAELSHHFTTTKKSKPSLTGDAVVNSSCVEEASGYSEETSGPLPSSLGEVAVSAENSVDTVKNLSVCSAHSSSVASDAATDPCTVAPEVKDQDPVCRNLSPQVSTPCSSDTPATAVSSPTILSTSPNHFTRSPVSSRRSQTPDSLNPPPRSPVSSCPSPLPEGQSPVTYAESPVLNAASPEIRVCGYEKERVTGCESTLHEGVAEQEERSNAHALYSLEGTEELLSDRIESDTNGQEVPAVKPSQVNINETCVTVSSVETTIVYTVNNCCSDTTVGDKSDCDASQVSCSTESIMQPTFRLSESPVSGNTGTIDNIALSCESVEMATTSNIDNSHCTMEETLDKHNEEDWEIIKVDPNSTETLQDDQVSGVCSNEGSNLSCMTTNTEPDRLDDGSKCSSYNTEESYSAADAALLYQDPLKEDEAALLAAAWDAVGSTTTDKILRDIQDQQQHHLTTLCCTSGEVSVIPCQEELQVRLEETSLPAWHTYPHQPATATASSTSATSSSGGSSMPLHHSHSHSHVKLELEVTLTPEVDSQVSSSTVDGGTGLRKEVGCCQPVIAPTTIVCLPTANSGPACSPAVQPLPSLPGPQHQHQPAAPASSSALPYIALTTSTPVRALPTKTVSKSCSVSGSRMGRGSLAKPPPGAVNLERSYQICQAVIQNSPNRDQLQGQLRPPPGLGIGLGLIARPPPPPPPPPPSAQVQRYPVSAGPASHGQGQVQGRAKPQQLLLKHVFTSQHQGIPVNMAVLPNSSHHITNDHEMNEYVIMRSGGVRRSNSAPPGGGAQVGGSGCGATAGARLSGTAPRPASAAAPPHTAADCLCSLKPMQACLKCGAFCHQDCISASRLCITCFTQ